MPDRNSPTTELTRVTLTTASGHQFTYAMNPVTVANALVRLEQSQLHADKKAALSWIGEPVGPDQPPSESAPVAG